MNLIEAFKTRTCKCPNPTPNNSEVVLEDDGVCQTCSHCHRMIANTYRPFASKASKQECTCPILDLMIRGCRCGQMEREKGQLSLA